MLIKSKENALIYPVPYEFDLFGETSVTISEVNLWMQKVPKMDINSPRYDWYIKNWDVVGKINLVKQKFHTLDDYFMQSAANDATY